MIRADLVKTLELVQPALADNDMVPIYTCFMFDGGTISAYNDVLGIVAKCKGLEKSPFAVNGKILLGLLQNSHGLEAEFSVSKEEVRVECGRSTLKLPYFGESDFLFKEPNEKWVVTIKLNASVINGIATCLTTTSHDLTMPAFMGVTFDVGKSIRLYTCDGDAITRYTPKTGVAADPIKGTYTVPNQFCEALIKISEATEVMEGSLQINGNWAKANLGDYTIYGRMIEGRADFSHEDWIGKMMVMNKPFIDVPKALKEALARARVVADAESAKTTITVEGKQLKLLTDTHMGTVRDVLAVKGHHDVKASVHASLMQRSLNVCDTLSIRDNCTVYRLGDTVLQVVANIGE